MLKKYLNYFYKIGIVFISVFTIANIVLNGNQHFFYGDDFSFGIYRTGEGIFDCLIKEAGKIHGGGYFAHFLTKFFNFKIAQIFHVLHRFI